MKTLELRTDGTEAGSMEGDEFGLIEGAIIHAAVAGGCSVMAREEPEAAEELIEAADFYSARAGALLETWLSRRESNRVGEDRLRAPKTGE